VSGVTEGYVWDLAEGMPTIIEDGGTRYITGPDGLPIEQVGGSGATAYSLRDQLGSTRGLTDSTGQVVERATYDAYGNVRGESGSVSTPFGYPGQYTDSEFGLQYLRARYYDPSTEQFLTVGTLTATTQQPYSYAGGSPVNLVDPAGLASVGACLSLNAGVGQGGMLSGCIVGVTNGSVTEDVPPMLACTPLLFSAPGCMTAVSRVSQIGVTRTAGGGAQTPGAGIYGGVQVSNATSLCDLGGWFEYGGASALEPISVAADGFGGRNSAGRAILGGQAGLGLGAGPVPAEVRGGMSCTWPFWLWSR
jgi:RHS repeat-associated protein